jgi:porin
MVLLDGVPGHPPHSYGTNIRIGSKDGTLAVVEADWSFRIQSDDSSARLERPPKNQKSLENFGTVAANSNLMVTESQSSEEATRVKVGLGGWYHDAKFDHLSQLDAMGQPLKKSNYGSYFILEFPVAKNTEAFFRYGVASEEVNPVKSNLALGLRLTKFLPNRPNDQYGIAYTSVHASSSYTRSESLSGRSIDSEERVFEMTYKIAVSENFYLQPDVQFIKNPGFDSSLKKSTSGFLRVEIDF